MKAKPVKYTHDNGFIQCPINEATHITINIPGPTGILTLPINIHSTNRDKKQWYWNGSIETPTLVPSVLTNGYDEENNIDYRCHSHITLGKVNFLKDCTHSLANKTIDLKEVN